MKTTRTCPKCASKKLFVVGVVRQPEPGNPLNAYPMAVTSERLPTGRGGVFASDSEQVSAGLFEAWVCAACGFTEWYARHANEALARMAQHPESGVVFLDGEGPASPYR
jgi:predicted nucleic-acid-binding Zn-ribbon protein